MWIHASFISIGYHDVIILSVKIKKIDFFDIWFFPWHSFRAWTIVLYLFSPRFRYVVADKILYRMGHLYSSFALCLHRVTLINVTCQNWMIVLFEMHPIVSATYRLATQFLSLFSTYYTPLDGPMECECTDGEGEWERDGKEQRGERGRGSDGEWIEELGAVKREKKKKRKREKEEKVRKA